MIVKFDGKRHLVTMETTVVYGFRLKQWKFMEYALHVCEDCPDPYPENQFIVVFDPNFIKKCRGQRFSEWLAWEPDEEDFQRWELHVKKKNGLTEKEITDFQQQLDDGVNWGELE